MWLMLELSSYHRWGADVSDEQGRPDRPDRAVDVHTSHIVNACQAAGIDVGVERLPNQDPDFLHQREVILVRDAYIEAVRTVVGGGDPADGLIDGVTLYSLQGAQISDTVGALAAIDAQLGVGVAAPNHVLWHSVAHCEPAQPKRGSIVSTAPSHAAATQCCQHGPTFAPVAVCIGGGSLQACTHWAVARHACVPKPETDSCAQFSKPLLTCLG